MNLKVCRKCGIELNSENWYRGSKKTQSNICKDCQKKKSREYYNENKNEVLKRQKEWMDRNPDYYRKYHKKHPDEYKRRHKNFLIERKRKFVEMLGGKCQKCGYHKNFSALAFHHKIPSEKECENEWLRKSFIDKIKNGDIELLCQNCHCEFHNPQLEIRNT